MIGLDITANLGDAPWTDIETPRTGVITRIGLLPDGMTSGHPVIIAAIELPDGTHILGQTSFTLYLKAADALIAAEQQLQDPT